MQKYRVLPDLTTAIIHWSYLITVLLLALIVQLELMKLSIWPVVWLVLAIALMIIELKQRQLILTTDQLTLKRPFSYRETTLAIQAIQIVMIQKRKVIIKTDDEKEFHFMLLKKNQMQIKTELQKLLAKKVSIN